MLAFLGWEWKSTTGSFSIGRFWPFTWKKSSVDFTTIVVFCNHGSVHFSILRVRANALYDCYSGIFDSFIFIENSRLFFPVRGLLCLYDKQNNTWLLVDMEFFFLCSTWHLTRELSSETLEEKFHIYARPCIILYLFNRRKDISNKVLPLKLSTNRLGLNRQRKWAEFGVKFTSNSNTPTWMDVLS